ncbi:hypothetical protein EC968_008227 [Mortierella alpina]|nr:hypothetical protein EC968_008227 [Mortierella alpina]
MTNRKILSRRSLEPHEPRERREQRSIRMQALPDEDAGLVFWEDFCALHGWPETPNATNVHRYIEVFVNGTEKKINQRRGLVKGDDAYRSGHDLFIKPVLRLKARLQSAQSATTEPASGTSASPAQMPSHGNFPTDDAFGSSPTFNSEIGATIIGNSDQYYQDSGNSISGNNHMDNERLESELDTSSDDATTESRDGDYADDNKHEAAPIVISGTSQVNRPDIFSIPEIAWLLSRFLDEVDLGRLCRTSKGLQHVFHSMLWHHYVYMEGETLTEALNRNMACLRSLDLMCDATDPKVYDVFKGCSSLNRLRVFAEDDYMDDYYNKKEHLRPLTSVISRQHYLTQLELNTVLVGHFPNTFLSAFLALGQLRRLRVSMTVKGPTISTALWMLVKLLNKHPRLQAILFGDWCCEEDFEEYHSVFSDEYHSAFSDDNEVEDEIGDQETKTFNELEHQLRASGYPKITQLELPPRQCHPYPATFLKPLLRFGLPNIRSLRLPGASLTDEQCFCRHADTLTTLILSSFITVSSAVLHQVLLQCCVLKVLRLEGGYDISAAYTDIDFKTGRWKCMALEVLWLSGSVFSAQRRVGSPLLGYRDRVEPRKYFWTQVGRLSKLQELVIGSTTLADSLSDSFHDASGGPLMDEPQWKWLRRRRPALVVEGSLNLNEPGSRQRPDLNPVRETLGLDSADIGDWDLMYYIYY